MSLSCYRQCCHFSVYVGEEAQEEPNLEYLPDNYQIIAPQGTGTNALEASLMLLQESLDSGAALAQFEVVSPAPCTIHCPLVLYIAQPPSSYKAPTL